MPWKLILAIVLLALLICLIGFNWGYSSNVSLGFYIFEEVPIIITIGISFLGGALFAIPYAIRSSLQLKKRQQKKIAKSQPNTDKIQADTKRAARKNKKSEKKDDPVLPDVPPGL